jgi:hypothetical protein
LGAGLASRILALANGRIRRLGFWEAFLGLFIICFPESTTVGVALGSILILLGLADAGGAIGFLICIDLPTLRERVLLRTLRFAARSLRQWSPSRAANDSTK